MIFYSYFLAVLVEMLIFDLTRSKIGCIIPELRWPTRSLSKKLKLFLVFCSI